MSVPKDIINMKYKICVVGLITEAERLYDIRRNRFNSLKKRSSDYTNLDKIRDEAKQLKKLFKKINGQL